MTIVSRDAAVVFEPREGCGHEPECPAWDAPDHDAAKVVQRHDELGVSVLCNGVWVFADTGERLPDGTLVAPHRPACPHRIPASKAGAR